MCSLKLSVIRPFCAPLRTFRVNLAIILMDRSKDSQEMLSKIQNCDSVVKSSTDIRQTDITSRTPTAGYFQILGLKRERKMLQ